MPKRRIFSKRDGTTFLEDVEDISQDVKDFFNGLPAKLKKWMYEASKIVSALERLNNFIAEGSPGDKAINIVLGQIKGEVDERLYEVIRKALVEFVARLKAINEEPFFPNVYHAKFDVARFAIQELSGLSELEADTVTQVARYTILA